jgi:HEAT repeat protein
MSSVSATGEVMCQRCGQQLVLPMPAKPAGPVKAVPIRPPQVVDDEPAAPVRAKAMPVQPTVVPVTHVPVAQATAAAAAKPRRRSPTELEDVPPRKGGKRKAKPGVPGWMIGVGAAGVLVIIGLVVTVVMMMGGDGNKPAPTMLARNERPVVRPTPTPSEPRKQPVIEEKKPAPAKKQPDPEPSKTPPPPATAKQDTPAPPEGSSEQPAGFGGGGSGPTVGGADVYPYVLKAAVFIVVQTTDNRFGMGSGSLIDKKSRLVLTNFHVAGDAQNIAVFFPVYDKSGKLIVEKERFVQQLKSKSSIIEPKLIASNAKCDLSLLQLPRLPAGVEALPVAKQSVRVGERVHSVGNPGRSGALWVYAPGIVRQVYHRKWTAMGGGKRFNLEADIIETQSPTNQGDSGGPLVNDRGELVGVTQGGTGGELSSFSIFIDVSEVRKFVEGAVQDKLNMAWKPDARGPLLASGAAPPSGNLADVVAKLTSPDATTRAKAAETLGEMGEKARDAIPSLLKLLNDTDDFVKRTVASSLTKIGLPAKSDIPLLAKSLMDPSTDVRRYAAATLEKMGTDTRSVLNEMSAALGDTDAGVKQALARAFGKFGREGKEKAQRQLEEMLNDSDRDTRVAAAEGLARIYSATNDLESLKKLLKHQDTEIQAMAVKGLPALGKGAKVFLNELLELAKNDTGEVRRAALQVLAALDPADARVGLNLINDVLKSGDTATKAAAMTALGNLGKEAPTAAINTVKDALQEEGLQTAALECLIKLAPNNKAALTPLVELVKEDGESAEAAAKAIGELGSAALPVVNDLIRQMDTSGNVVTPADRERVDKFAKLVAKIGRAAVPALRKGLQRQGTIRWGCAKALGEIGPPAKDALRDLQIVAATEINRFIRDDVEDAISRIANR